VSPTKSDSAVDSIVKKAISDTVLVHHFADSVNRENIVLKGQRDSLLYLLGVTKGSLKGKDRDIQALIDNINQAEAGNNQGAALVACDSLKTAYPIAKGLVTQYIRSNDSLIKVNDLISRNKDTIIWRLNSAFTDANNSLFEISRQYGVVSGSYKKALKQAGKRWGIGPQIGVSVVGDKFAPVISFGVTYNLIKF